MGLSLSAENKTLIKIFKIEEQYIIPPYQRAYSWEYDECFTLYSDIMEAFQNKDNQEDYFIGNIVIAKSSSDKDKLEVIDGQQRLTTLLLFIKVLSIYNPEHKALKDCLEIEDWESDETFPRIESEIFESEDKKNLKEVLSFDKEKFEKLLLKYVNKKGLINEKKCANRFEANIMFFYNWIKFYTQRNELRDFIKYLLTQVYLLPIELEGRTPQEAREKALKIFETINNRGRDLSDSDIFKARLYEKAGKLKEEKKFISIWREFKNRCELQNIKIDEVFRFYSHIIRGKNNITGTEINLRHFFIRYEKSPFNEKNYKEILEDLFRIIEVVEFINQNSNQNTVLAKWLQLINRYTNKYPMFLLVVYIFKNGFEDKNIIEFSKKLVRYIYYKGATTTIKFEIYTMINDIIRDKELDKYIQKDIKIDDINTTGGLKNGYALLSFYVTQDKSIAKYDIDKLITHKDSLNWREDEIKESKNSLANFVILDIPKRSITINKKAIYYQESNIENIYEVIELLESFSYQNFLERDKKLKDNLVKFFMGEL